jgi:hypothetical protein
VAVAIAIRLFSAYQPRSCTRPRASPATRRQ